MQEFVHDLNDVERHVLAEISVNASFKKILQIALEDAARSIAMLNPDDPEFASKYRANQFIIGLYTDWLTMVRDLYEEFYEPLQSEQAPQEGDQL